MSLEDEKEIKHLLQKIMSSPALNGGFAKLEYKFDLMADDLSSLKYDFKTQSLLVNQRFEDTEKNIQEIKSDLKEIKECLPALETHVALVKDIGGGEHLVVLRDSVRSFDWTKKLLLGVLGSGVTAGIYAVWQLIH